MPYKNNELKYKTLAEALDARVDKSAGPLDCWPCTRQNPINHYGYVHFGRRTFRAHIVAFKLAGGVLTPERPWVLHRCDNAPCCNPVHLYAGSPTDNVHDMHDRGRWISHKKEKPFCKYGHPYSGENLYRRKDGGRDCRICMVRRARESNARHGIHHKANFSPTR